MGHCKFCGRELGEDGKCTCAEFQDNEKLNDDLFEDAPIVVTNEPAPEKHSRKKKKRSNEDKPIKRGSTLKTLLILIAIILVVGLVIYIMLTADTYKKPIKTLTKGISNNSTELIIESIYTETSEAEIRLRAKNNGLDWKDYVKKNDKSIESALNGLGIKRIKVDILAKEKLSGSNLDQVKQFYDNTYGLTVKKAYRVEVEFTLKVDGVKVTRSGWLCVAKIKGEGWRYCPQCSTNTFDFLEAALNFD